MWHWGATGSSTFRHQFLVFLGFTCPSEDVLFGPRDLTSSSSGQGVSLVLGDPRKRKEREDLAD